MHEYLHDNLILHTRIFYTLQRGKRTYFQDIPENVKKTDSYFEFEAHLFPPLMLLPITWKRYGYTLEDVHSTYDKIDASYVWAISLLLLASVYEPESSSAGVRSTFQSMFAFLFISRKTVFDVFINSQTEFISKSKQSILCSERPDHKPLLPKSNVTRELFDYCKNVVPVRSPSFCWAPHYVKLIPFKDILLVPVEYDSTHNLVYMVRVVKKSVYDSMEIHPKLCVVTMPVTAFVGEEKTEYVLLEEACFFQVGIDPEEKTDEKAVDENSSSSENENLPNASRKRPKQSELNQSNTKKKKLQET